MQFRSLALRSGLINLGWNWSVCIFSHTCDKVFVVCEIVCCLSEFERNESMYNMCMCVYYSKHATLVSSNVCDFNAFKFEIKCNEKITLDSSYSTSNVCMYANFQKMLFWIGKREMELTANVNVTLQKIRIRDKIFRL